MNKCGLGSASPFKEKLLKRMMSKSLEQHSFTIAGRDTDGGSMDHPFFVSVTSSASFAKRVVELRARYKRRRQPREGSMAEASRMNWAHGRSLTVAVYSRASLKTWFVSNGRRISFCSLETAY